MNVLTDLFVPSLAIDIGRNLDDDARLERLIVAGLMVHLESFEFRPRIVFDGEERVSVVTPQEAMELIFNLDEAWVRFNSNRWVYLTMGNGVDIIADWNYGVEDLDGFNAAMNDFEVSNYE